jgi:hypothetical protein
MLGNRSHSWRGLSIVIVALLALPAIAQAQKWTPMKNQPPFKAIDAEQLTDGTILVQALEYVSGSRYWKLTPDNTGSYINGTWTKVASLPSDYDPLYHTSQVLADGRVVVAGGEYNFGNADWTKLAAIYDPVANTWTPLAAPSSWSNIGDGESVVLPDETMMLANAVSTQEAILDPTTLTWTNTGKGKADGNDEEGWTLLPDGSVLTVDTTNGTNSELWRNGTWSSAGSTIVQLADPSSAEIGPGVLRPDGTVFYIGGTGNNAIYTPVYGGIGSWAVGPMFPNIGGQLDVADGPAAVLPDGNVLVGASPGVYNPPTYFFEFDGTNLNQVPAPPHAPKDPSYAGRMLVLPTGQIMYTDGGFDKTLGLGDVRIYTARGHAKDAWAPVIRNFPPTVIAGTTYKIKGLQFNGLTAACQYGDDAQCSTSFPLVRITNNNSGHVQYCRTHDHSTMGIATGKTLVTTMFDAPAILEKGFSTLEVVANGIASKPVAINVKN